MPRIRKIESKRSKNERVVWRGIAYIRLSKDDGNDESLSVINRKKIIQEYLEKFFKDEYTIVDVYVDDGISGKTDDSSASFFRMVDDVKL
nr:recombinase family protein [Clostridium tertium]